MMRCNFTEFLENREHQEQAVQRALMQLYYQKGYDPATIVAMPAEQLVQTIHDLGLQPTTAWTVRRFVAMIKNMAQRSEL